MKKSAQDNPDKPLSLKEFAETGADPGEVWQLRLYVAGQTPRSVAAFANLKRICEDNLAGRYNIEVVDLVKHPQLAADAGTNEEAFLVPENQKRVRK